MRRSQTGKHHPRPSVALTTDELSVLREGNETKEDILRRQLLDKGRENDKLLNQIQHLQNQLATRPTTEQFQAYEAERKDLELILAGSQRENERCMAELTRAKTRIQLLERELTRLAGDNWHSSLDIAPIPPFPARGSIYHRRSSTVSSITSSIKGRASHSPSPSPASAPNSARILDDSVDMGNGSTTIFADPDSTILGQSEDEQIRHIHPVHPPVQSQGATLAQIESVRLLVLGIEQRLQTREDKLGKTMEKAENEGKKFEAFRHELTMKMDGK